MKYKVIRPTPTPLPPSRIQLDLSVDEVQILQAAVGSISCRLLDEAGRKNGDTYLVWKGLIKALRDAGELTVATLDGVVHQDAVVTREPITEYAW